MFILIQSTKKFLLFAFTFFFSFANIFAATKTWTGLANDGNWSTPFNWSNGSVPNSLDDVVLDNSSKNGSYVVTLPNSSVTIKTVSISPSAGNTIQLILPSSNTLSPAFSATGPGYGLTINNGGIFKNSSGASNMTTVNIADSIRINNGGRFIHNTQRSHTANVTVLSKMPGTENGSFEFDVPGTQSYSVSISGRTYGNLIFSATAAGGGRNYFCTGSNTLTVNGNLQINAGVNFNMQLGGMNGNIIVKENYVQNGGTLNLASDDGNSTLLKIAGDVTQASMSLLTETNSGTRAIELNGSSQQNISMHGSISNNLIFRMNNAAGAVLQTPLSLPYKLELVKGNIITSSSNILTLQPGATISADSTIANGSFIIGPLRKEGLSATDHFLFPVGKTNEFRWLELKNATGNFNVEYIAGNARDLSSSYGSGIDHISSHGYWTIEPDATPSPSAKIELSFANASGSGVTDMATLRASQLSSGMWIDLSNIATTGTPGAAGSVVSNPVTGFTSTAKNFVLASSVSDQNPLPIILTSFAATSINDEIKLNWDVASADDIDYFEIWSADDNNNFEKIESVQAASGETKYQFIDKRKVNGVRYYKLRIVEKDGDPFFSKIISVKSGDNIFKILSIAPSPTYDNATVSVYTNERTQLQFIITGIDGKIIKKRIFDAEQGKNIIPCNFSGLASGSYVLSCFDSKGNVGVIRFVKL